MKKKGQISTPLVGAISAVLLLLVLGFTIAISQNVIGDYGDTLTANSFEANATTDAQGGLDDISGFQGTMALTVAAGTIISILIAGLLGFFLGRRGGLF